MLPHWGQPRRDPSLLLWKELVGWRGFWENPSKGYRYQTFASFFTYSQGVLCVESKIIYLYLGYFKTFRSLIGKLYINRNLWIWDTHREFYSQSYMYINNTIEAFTIKKCYYQELCESYAGPSSTNHTSDQSCFIISALSTPLYHALSK